MCVSGKQLDVGGHWMKECWTLPHSVATRVRREPLSVGAHWAFSDFLIICIELKVLCLTVTPVISNEPRIPVVVIKCLCSLFPGN